MCNLSPLRITHHPAVASAVASASAVAFVVSLHSEQ